VFVSSAVESVAVSDVIGTKPWDNVSDDAAELVRQHNEGILASKSSSSFGFIFRPPNNPTDRYFFFVRLLWVGIPGVAYAAMVWEFDHNLAELSRREFEVLERLGRGIGTKSTGRDLGITKNTVQAHIRNIRLKLRVSSIDELTAFAGQYSAATASDFRQRGDTFGPE